MKDQKTLDVELCMGSSCFARGNKEALPLIQEYLQEESHQECARLKGHLCADHCSRGPLISIDGEQYDGITHEAALDLIRHWCER